jgi:hypothetical protein
MGYDTPGMSAAGEGTAVGRAAWGPLGRLRSPLTRGIVAAVAVFALSRLLTTLVAYAITVIATSQSLLDVLSHWDGLWYLAIVRDGYSTEVPDVHGGAAQNNLAFLPGFPLAIKGFSWMTGASPHISGALISPLAGAAAAAIIYVLARRLSNDETAIRTVTLFSFYPSAFVLSMLYSESLYILLASTCLLALLQRRWLLAGLSAAVAGVTRPNGLILAVCCAWAAWQAAGGSRRALLAPLLAPLGALLHVAYLYAHTGDALAYFHVVDRGWGQRFDLGVSNLYRILHGFRGFAPYKALIMALSLTGGVIAIYLVVRWRPPGPVFIYVIGVIGLTMLTTATTSVPRYFLSGFPALIPIARVFPGRAFPLAVACSAVLMVVLFFLTGLNRLPP